MAAHPVRSSSAGSSRRTASSHPLNGVDQTAANDADSEWGVSPTTDPMAEWDDPATSGAEQLTIGIPEIDREHSELMAHHQALVRAIADGEDVHAFALTFCLLVRRVGHHFSNEERLMRDIGYTDYGDHKAEHDKLLRDAADFIHSISARFEKYDCVAVAGYFKHWLSNHIHAHDQRLGDFAKRHRPDLEDMAPAYGVSPI